MNDPPLTYGEMAAAMDPGFTVETDPPLKKDAGVKLSGMQLIVDAEWEIVAIVPADKARAVRLLLEFACENYPWADP